MASGGAGEDDGCVPLDIDNVHMLLQVEQEQIQRRTFTNWINAQLAKRCPPSFVSDLFSDLRDGLVLLDLLEVLSGQHMKRQRGRGVFQQRANIETALNFLRKKSIKLVNINIPDIIDGRPSIILGLVWTIINHCHIEELASTLSFNSCHSSLESLASSDSWSGSQAPASPVPSGHPSPLHRHFRISAKKALLMWVREQCQRVGCLIVVRDFKDSWRSGEAFLAILCALRPQLVDLSLVLTRSNQENLEEAFHLAEKDLHIPRLLEPQDIDVKEPDEKSIMTYVAQFLQYSNDMPGPDEHEQLFPPVQPHCFSPVNSPGCYSPAFTVSPLHQVSPSERAQEVSCWLQQAHQDLLETWATTEKSSYAEKYQVFHRLAGSLNEQRRLVMTLLAATRRCPEVSLEQLSLRTAWNHLEGELQRCEADLDLSLPPPLVSIIVWVQHAEAALAEEGKQVKDHAEAAKEARAQQDILKTICKEMSHQANILDTFNNVDDSGNEIVPQEKFDGIKRQLTHIRVTAKYQATKLEYQECRHTTLNLLGCIKAKVQSWKAPYTSRETACLLLQDWHETMERQGLLLILMDALQNLKEKANAYTSKPALSEGSQLVSLQVKEAESEAAVVTQEVTAVRITLERVVSAWEMYNKCFASLQTWLAQKTQTQALASAGEAQDISEGTSCQAQLNEVGNFLIEVSESPALAEQLSKLNMQWAEYMKRTMFAVSSEPSVGPVCHQMPQSLVQEANWLFKQSLEVASIPLKANRQKVQTLRKKMVEINMSSIGPYSDKETLKILKERLADTERTCDKLQSAASRLEGCLAELDNWSTEALECYQHLKEEQHRGHRTQECAVNAKISRGLLLEKQVLTEGQNLQDLTEHIQRTSPQQHLCTSSMQDRISKTVSHCEEILEMFNSLGFRGQIGEAPEKQPPFEMLHQIEAGSIVVAATKHVDQIRNNKKPSWDGNQLSLQGPSQATQLRTRGQNWPKNISHEKVIPIRHDKAEILPQSVKNNTQASSPTQKDELSASKILTSTVAEGSTGSATSQTHKVHLKSRIREQPNPQQKDKTYPQPPVMDCTEVHSKARSMARSRLEKARFRLQGCIQEAIKLFAGKEISELEAKRKQRALKILQPVFLEEFLAAVDGFGAFCSGIQVQELMLLSDSVRQQWEDVHKEMATFVPTLWSTLKLGTQSVPVVECEKHTNYNLHEATDQTDHDYMQHHQAVTEGAPSTKERVEFLQELCETLAPGKSPCHPTDKLRESDEALETKNSDIVLLGNCRGWQPQGDVPLTAPGMLPGPQSFRILSPSVDGLKQEAMLVKSEQLHGDTLQLRGQDIPAGSENRFRRPTDDNKRSGSSVQDKGQPLKVSLQHIADSKQKVQTHLQTVVKGDTMETKQEAEWTIIPEIPAPLQAQPSFGQEVVERYRNSCSGFQSQLQKNKLHMELFMPESATISTLLNQKNQLQALKQETEALWFEHELQYAQLSQISQLITEKDWSDVERKREELTQQWRHQQICMQTSMVSLENTTDLVESADNQMELITETLNRIIRDPVEISSLSLADPQLIEDLQDMSDKLESQMRMLLEQSTEEERQGPKATSPSSLCQARHNSLHLLQQLRQQLDKVQSAAQSLNCFLATAREVEAEIPSLLPNQDPSRQQNEADWKEESYSWQPVMEHRLQTALEQSHNADSTLKAAEMTLTMDGATVLCWDLATSLSQKVVDMEKSKGKKNIQEMSLKIQEMISSETYENNMREDSPVQGQTQEQQHQIMEEESGLKAKGSGLEEENDTRAQGDEELKAQTGIFEEKALVAKQPRGRRSSQIKREGDTANFAQMRLALMGTLKEIQEAAEQLGLQEPTLPALQQRKHALIKLESQQADQLSELQCISDAASRAGDLDASQSKELEDLWEETTKAVTERQEQCCVLTELLKRFQFIRGELSGTLQRAESTINEQASYMGRDNLQRLHTLVQETKAELNCLGPKVEEVRSTCRQLHTHLQHIPECTTNPFEGEADALMDLWLDISERTESHLENLHLGLTLWDGVLQLSAEVDSWADSTLAAFTQSSSCQTEEHARVLENEILSQEERMECFHRRAAEIQALLQSPEPPLELQVVETQMRKKMEQLRELVSDAADVSKQMAATKRQISDRMAECYGSLQRIQDSLLTLSDSDPTNMLTKLEDLYLELQTQDQRAESLDEDLHIMASITSPENLQSLAEDGFKLQGKVRTTHQAFSDMEERTKKSIQALNRMRNESEQLRQWLQATEDKATKKENLCLLQEVHQQGVRTETLRQLVSSLQSSPLQQCSLVEESGKLMERYHDFSITILGGNKEMQSPVCRDTEVSQEVELDFKVVPGRAVDDTTAMCPPAYPEAPSDSKNSDGSLNVEKIQIQSTRTLKKPHPSAEPDMHSSVVSNMGTDHTIKYHTCVSIQQAEILVRLPAASLTQKDALAPNEVSEIRSKTKQELALTSSLPKTDSKFPARHHFQPIQVCNEEGVQDTSLPIPENESRHLAAQSNIFKSVTDAKEQESKNISLTPKRVFTVVLDMEHQDMQQNGNAVQPCQGAEHQNANISRIPQRECGLFSTDEADSVIEIPPVLVNNDLRDLNSTDINTIGTHEKTHSVSSETRGFAVEFLLIDTKEATLLDVKPKAMTDLCHPEEQSLNVVLYPTTGPAETASALTETQSSAANIAHVEMAEGEKREEVCNIECKETINSKLPERCDAMMPEVETDSMLPLSLEATQVEPGQIQGDMEAERTSDAGKTAFESPGHPFYKHISTMQETLSDIQGLVERSNIINRTPHIDLNWYLQTSPGEPEIRLIRTVQKVLACRYQPAELDVTAMAKQLEEAEDLKCSVIDQVAMNNTSSTSVSDPSAWRSIEGLCSTALLDASATVQVKAAQLDQVKQYHQQMRITKTFLDTLASAKEKISLNALGSSALQAEKLNALIHTMGLRKGMLQELLRLSRQLSVHLSDAESSGALFAQLGDVQDEWRLLEGSIKRAFRHAFNSASQASFLIKETKELKNKIEALQVSIQSCGETYNTKSPLEVVCLTTNLKLYSQLYLHLNSQSDAIVHFSLGERENDEVKRNLQEMESLLSEAKNMLDSTCRTSGFSSATIYKQFQDLIVRAKQAETHYSIEKKLSLFPEEARIQIAEIKKFQTDILSRRSNIQAEVEEMKVAASDMNNEDHDQVLKTLQVLCESMTENLNQVLDMMKTNLQEREKLLSKFANMDAWLAETHAKRDPCTHFENVSRADISKLESKLKIHKLATTEIENQLNLFEDMERSCREIAVGLSPGESRYLVNRVSGLWTELDGLLAHEKAASWELEELIHERTSSDEELSTIQDSLKEISTCLEQQRFPLTQETLSKTALLKRMLMEHQCHVQEIPHCQEAKRSSLLCTIGELQDKCKALSVHAFEQDKYLHLRKQMEDSRDIAKEQIQRAQDKMVSMGERFRLCQALLVELPLVKTQCQEAADQLEVIAQELEPSELNSERQRICCIVETLVSWENLVTDDIKNLEARLLLGLQFSSEILAVMELFQRAKLELQVAEPISLDEKVIDTTLQRWWVLWRNMESWMRMLKALGTKEKVNLKNHSKLLLLGDSAMQECHAHMESLSHARELIKDYQWAAQGAIGFLLNAEATFLSAPGGFLDCTEEQRQTQQAVQALEDGFQAHICHLVELVPQHVCLSQPKTEQLHISILSQLLVGRAVLEAQAQLRLESLQRCEINQQSHKSCHEDIRQLLSGFEAKLLECASGQVASHEKCIAQHNRAKLLLEDLRSLGGRIEELRAGCPMYGCGVGKDGELGILWRHWVSLRRGVGLLMAHSEQRAEEWRDITMSMEQCCSSLASLQTEVPDSSTVSFIQEEPKRLLDQAEMHQTDLDKEQQALASLEHQLEHALSLTSSQDPVSPGPVGKTLVKIQENIRSLKERNLLVVAAAQAEEKEREQIKNKIEEVERHMFTILPELEVCSNDNKPQELRMDMSSQRSQLQCIIESLQSRYTEIPADISKKIQDVQQSLQEKIAEKSDPFRKLVFQVGELSTGLEKVKELLDERSSSVSEAQSVLKHVWDGLDTWHGRLMLVESEVQDLAEEHPDQAHLFMDQLTQPLQLYQNVAQTAEHRTAFLSKIPVCLQEFENILGSATCWLDEARAWLSAPYTFTTGRSLQNHANSLQLVLDDSERIRNALQDFKPVLAEISTMCDISAQEERLEHSDQQVLTMQREVTVPLQLLLQAVGVVEALEAELKSIEKNVPKIRTILSSVDNSSITLKEHLHNRQVIQANVQSMQKTLEEMESCKEALHLPQGAEGSLGVFSRVQVILQDLKELEQHTQQQACLLQEKIGKELETSKDFGFATTPDVFGVLLQQDRSPQSNLLQEASDESNSEEEAESCHSSSSDTLTCSIPEDPEDTLNEDVAEMKQLSDVMVTESLAGHIYFEVETSSVGAEPQRLPMKLGLDTKTFGPENIQTRLITMESQLEPGANIGDASRLKTVTSEPQMAAVVLASDDQLALASTPELHASAKCDMDVQMQSHQAALEDTRLIPVRPITPFTATRASVKSIEERDRNPCSSPHQGLNQSEGSITVVVGSQHAPEVQTRLAGHHTDDTYQQRWRQLHTHISQKLSTLEKVQEEHQTLISSGCGRRDEKVPEGDLISAGCSGAVLQLVNESIDMLKQIVKSSDDSDVKEQLYLAVRKVLLCLDALTDFQLTPSSAGEDDVQLRMLQQECVSSQLVSVSDLLSNVESKTRPSLLGEEPDTLGCLTSLQQCLQTVQLTLSSSRDQLTQRLDLKKQHQELFLPQLCVLDEFELGQSETFPNLKDIPSLKQCVPVRHLRESPGGKAMLLEASWSLLRGISRLLELGEEEITEGQQSQVFNCTQIQAVLCRRQKFLQLLRSQLAFVQYLFQREPEALMCQEDERVKLEVRAKALQQQALEQEVAFRMRLQDRVYWKENCFQLGRALDELETIISGGELEREDYEVSVVANRRQSCQQTLAQLDESRASLGWLMDQRSMLLTKPAVFSSLVSQAGGAVELRWRSTYRQTEEEIQRCGDIQDRWARFQTNFASLSKRLTDADKHLKTCSALTDSTDQDQECIYRNLISLLDFSIEMEAMSFQRASVSQYAAQLFHLREAECPSLRMHLAQLEVSWSKLTSNVTNVQDQLQQKLLLAWPPAKLLSHLEDWLKKTMEPQLNQEKETVLKAKNAAEITQTLQRYRGLKAVMVNGQPLLDFLSQSGPPVMEADDQTLSSKYTIFAEQLGNFRLQWMLLQRELESQMHGAEQILHICADREKQLQRLHNSVEQQKKCLRQWKQPSSQTLACKVLLEWEADAGKIKEVAATLQDLKSTRVLAEKEEEHPSDVAFCSQVERVSHACEDLSQQMQSLKPTLQQTVEDWANFERNLREVSLHTTRVRSTFQYLQAPLFSVKQTGEYMDILQQLQEKEKQRKELWTDMDKSCQSLVKMLYRGTAQSLSERMEGEQKRWRDLLQELVDEHRKIGEMLSVWQEYNRLSDSFSLQLKHLWHEWEVLLNSLVSPQLDKQTIHSVEKLQNAAEDLQSRLGDVLTSSKPLISRLEPLAANLIQSQTRMLSRDILLLSQMMSEAKKSLKGDSEQHKLFHSQLKAFEKQTQNVPQSQRATMNNKDSVKRELLELSELLPSLIDVRETSGHLTLSKQETETMHTLSRRWTKSLTHMTDIYRELQAESQCTQDFQQKCEDLMCIVEELEQESTSSEAESYSNLREILVAHQKQQVEMIRGNQLLQGLLCDAVKSVEKQTGEKRSELMAKVACMKERWFRSLSLAAQRRATTKQRLSWWRVYRRGLKPLWRLLSDVEPLLHPASTALCTLQQLQSCADNCQLLEKTLGQHFTIYTQTQEAGRNLCEAMTKSESLSQLQLELQAIEEVWKRTLSLLADRKAHVDTTIKKWLQFQNRVTSITSQLEELKKQLPERPAESEQDEYIQKTGISLQHLASGLRELATMKTDLFQYVAATDSALLEQQLEQLHGQWEELCMKVSLRRQEITDRLNAWTIFNDKNKEFCDWLTQMENKVCHSADLSIEEMVEKLKKDCMEEINLFSENKSHLKQLGEQLLLASDEAKQTQVHSSLQEVNQRWHNLFLHIEARVKKLKETLVTVQKLDKNMSNLRSWLSRIEAELSRPITYSVCHHQEIQRRLAEQQELQRDIEQHTEGVASVLSLCDVLLRDEDAAGSVEVESDSLQETSHSLDQHWRTICAMALDRRLRIEETWKLWCKFLDEYSRFEDWLKIAERTAANPNTADVLYAAAKEELKKFEGFQRQVHERLTQLELVNNQYRRLARENRTDCTSQLKAMVHEGNRRWDTLHRRVAAILRRLKYFTSQREDFEGTRESMLVWLTELDLQLTNVEHFSESDVHHKIQQLSSFQKEITLNTERIDGLIVFGEGLIQKSSPQDAVLIEDELEELHSYCQEVFGRLVRFHQRLSQPRVIIEEPELRSTTFSLESSLELIGRLWLGRGQGSPPATPSHLLGSPLERSGRETPVSVDSLPLEWDHTVDVGGSSSHEDEEEGLEEEGAYFSALSEVELTETQDEFVEAPEALRAFSLGSSRSMTVHDSQKWCSPEEAERLQVDVEHPGDAPPILTSTPVKQRYLRLMSQCSDSIEDIKRISLILDEEEQPEELGLTGLTESDKQSGIIERWELLQAQSTSDQHAGSQDPEKLTSDLDDIISWLENITPELNRQQQPNLAASIDLDNMAARAKDLKEMQKMFTHYKSTMLSVNLRALGVPEHQERLAGMNRAWSQACTDLQQWDISLRKTLMQCQDFHETLHSLLLWLAHAESRRYTVDISHPETPVKALKQHRNTLNELQQELLGRQAQQASLQALWSQLQPDDGAEERDEAQEKIHVTGSKLKLLLRQVALDLRSLQQRLDQESASAVQDESTSADPSQEVDHTKTASSTDRARRDSFPHRSFFSRVLRAAFPLHVLLLLLLLLPCLVRLSDSDLSCIEANNFARSFYPMLRYTNGPPPT